MTDTMVRSVRRAFDILEVFARLRRPLSLKDLMSELDCPSSSLADLLKTMSRIGCLSFDNATKTYFPTTYLPTLGNWIGDEILPSGDAYEALGELRADTGETILLGTPNDLEIQYLYVLVGPHPPFYRNKPNGRRPLVKSGVGWMVLSQSDDDAIDRVWRRSIACGMVGRKELPFEQLQDHVAFGRRHGYVVARDSINPSAAVVAVLLPCPAHGRQLVIGIGGPTDRIEANAAHIAAVLRERATRLARTAA
jgi:IclR family transcriptional regulator, KDG regulon repressor